jgi:hypothetical protein
MNDQGTQIDQGTQTDQGTQIDRGTQTDQGTQTGPQKIEDMSCVEPSRQPYTINWERHGWAGYSRIAEEYK